MPYGICRVLCDDGLTVVYANAYSRSAFGVAAGEQLVKNDELPRVRRDVKRHIEDGDTPFDICFSRVKGDGTAVSLNARCAYSPDGGGALTCAVDEVDARRSEIEREYNSYQRAASAVMSGNVGYYLFDLTKDICERDEWRGVGKITDLSVPTTYTAIYQYTATNFVFQDDRRGFSEYFSRDRLITAFHDGDRGGKYECRFLFGLASRWMLVETRMAEEPGSSCVKLMVTFRDIDKRKRRELQLHTKNEDDDLTGTLNRESFTDRMNEMLASDDTSMRHAIAVIHVAGLKAVNAELGHSAGDKVLRDTAENLRSQLRAGDLIARFSGDDFVLCLKNIPYDNSIDKRANLICQSMEIRFTSKISVSAEMGISMFPADGRTFEELYANALAAQKSLPKDKPLRYMFYQQRFTEGVTKQCR